MALEIQCIQWYIGLYNKKFMLLQKLEVKYFVMNEIMYFNTCSRFNYDIQMADIVTDGAFGMLDSKRDLKSWS